MKKTLLAVAISLIPFLGFAQKIEHDQIIKALNKRVMYTSWEKVNWTSETKRLEVSFLLEGNDMSMLINWQTQEMTGVERNANIKLYFADNTSVTLNSKIFAVTGVGKVSTPEVGHTTMGIQVDARGGIDELRQISRNQIIGIRIETVSGLVSFPVTAEESVAIAGLYSIYENRFFKDKL